MIIILAWWMLPLATTILAFGAATVLAWRDGVGSWAYAGHFVALFYYAAALIVSETAWLIWAVLR